MKYISKGYDNETLKKVQNVQLLILKRFISICEENELSWFLVYGSALGTLRHCGTIPWDDDIDVGMMRQDYEKLLEIYKEKGFGEDLELMTPYLNENYATRVTHLQLKNTTFISDYSKDLKCHLGINIDIFPFDRVSKDLDVRKKQFLYSFLYGKLLFLRGTSHPNIPLNGMKFLFARVGCSMIHFFLIASGMTASKLYKKFEKYCRLAQNEQTDEYSNFGDYKDERCIMKYNEIFPLKQMQYENLIVNVFNDCPKHLKEKYGSDYMKLPPENKRVNHYPYKINFEK